MGKAKTTSSSSSPRKLRPALTPEARENQLISLASDLAEKQLLEGTASSQVITHFLKLGTIKERMELEKQRKEIALLDAKTQSLHKQERSDEMYEKAIQAMKRYGGYGDSEVDIDDD